MAGIDQVMIAVPHIVQKYRWDCGLACSLMVLRFVSHETVVGFIIMCIIGHHLCSFSIV